MQRLDQAMADHATASRETAMAASGVAADNACMQASAEQTLSRIEERIERRRSVNPQLAAVLTVLKTLER